MSEPLYLITAPLRRLWSLDKYFQSFLNLDYPRDKLRFYFVINDAPSGVLHKVEEFKKNIGKSAVDIRHMDFGAPPDRRDNIHRADVTYKNLAKLRNDTVDFFASSDADYMLSIDSDIYVEPHILKEFNKWPQLDYLASWISNQIGVDPSIALFSNCLNVVKGKKSFENDKDKVGKYLLYQHVINIPASPQPFEVDMTGACFRISKKIVTPPQPCFGWHPQGEDPVFCEAVRMKGFKLWVIKNNLAFHDIKLTKEL